MISASKAMRLAIGCALLLALPCAAGAQGGVPVYNVKPECQFTQSAVPSPENEKTCLQEEQAAHAKLEQRWASYPSADRQECVSESSTGGSPSYVDLLTCLEMTADARALQRKNKTAK